MTADANDPVRAWVREFDGADVRRLAEAIEHVVASGQAILPLYIHSTGGSIYPLFAMIDLIHACPVPVATIALGTVQSAAVDLLSAGTRGHRYVGASTTVMVHDSADGWSSRKNNEVQALARQAQRERDLSFVLFAKHTGKTKKWWDQWLAKHRHADVFLTAAEAVSLGIADHVGVPSIRVNDGARKVSVA